MFLSLFLFLFFGMVILIILESIAIMILSPIAMKRANTLCDVLLKFQYDNPNRTNLGWSQAIEGWRKENLLTIDAIYQFYSPFDPRTMFNSLRPDPYVLVPDDAYGKEFRLFEKTIENEIEVLRQRRKDRLSKVKKASREGL